MRTYLVIIPYDVIENIFGKFIADNFNTIMAIIAVIAIVVRIFGQKKTTNSSDWLNKAQEVQNKRFEYMNESLIENNSESKKTQANLTGFKGNPKKRTRWYPTGWTYNEDTKLWEPPDYVCKESSEKWKWDPEKRIWIDKEKEAQMEKYRKYHEGQPPTFEEWKAQREKEQKEKEQQE